MTAGVGGHSLPLPAPQRKEGGNSAACAHANRNERAREEPLDPADAENEDIEQAGDPHAQGNEGEVRPAFAARGTEAGEGEAGGGEDQVGYRQRDRDLRWVRCSADSAYETPAKEGQGEDDRDVPTDQLEAQVLDRRHKRRRLVRERWWLSLLLLRRERWLRMGHCRC